MRVYAFTLLLPAAVALAGCVEPTNPTPPPTIVGASCDAGSYNYLVGTPLSTFDTSKVKGPVRVLAPGSVATMDYRGNRLNISTDSRGTVQQVYCG